MKYLLITAGLILATFGFAREQEIWSQYDTTRIGSTILPLDTTEDFDTTRRYMGVPGWRWPIYSRFVDADSNIVCSTSTDYAIEGYANNYGIYGWAETDHGVYGKASGSYGVKGLAMASFGVYGEAVGSYGVYGKAAIGHGVYGLSLQDYGVKGKADQDYGVYGEAVGSYGGYFEAGDSIGIYAKAPRKAGVFEADSNYGIYSVAGGICGILGRAEGNYGVFGESFSSFGVYGQASHHYGVYGVADSNYGVYGEAHGDYGVYGVADNYGIRGEAHNYSVYGHAYNFGIYGRVDTSYGVYGWAGSYGVYGLADWYGGFFTADSNYALACSSRTDSDTALWVKRGKAVFEDDVLIDGDCYADTFHGDGSQLTGIAADSEWVSIKTDFINPMDSTRIQVSDEGFYVVVDSGEGTQFLLADFNGKATGDYLINVDVLGIKSQSSVIRIDMNTQAADAILIDAPDGASKIHLGRGYNGQAGWTNMLIETPTGVAYGVSNGGSAATDFLSTHSNGTAFYIKEKRIHGKTWFRFTAYPSALVSSDAAYQDTCLNFDFPAYDTGGAHSNVGRDWVNGIYMRQHNPWADSGFTIKIRESVPGRITLEITDSTSSDTILLQSGGRIYTTGFIEVGDSMKIGGNIIPTDSGTQNLGSPSKKWAILYADSVAGCDAVAVADIVALVKANEVAVSQGKVILALEKQLDKANKKASTAGGAAGVALLLQALALAGHKKKRRNHVKI